MDTPELILACEACKEPIAPGKGRLWIDYAEINRRQEAVADWEAKNQTPGKRGVVGFKSMYEYPSSVRWQAHHAACDPDPEAGAYAIESERLTSWADLVHWTGHLMGMKWFAGTDWSRLLDGVATGAGPRLRPARPSELHA